MPLPELPQNQVGMMTRIVDVAENSCAANLTGVVDYNVAKAKNSLKNRGRYGHILNLGQKDVPGGPGNQSIINFYLGVSERVTDHIALQMIIGGNQQQA